MSLKLKALGLGLLATLAMSAVVVMNASAAAGGHFVTTGNAHAHIQGHVTHPTGGPHNLHLVNHGLEGEIGCDIQSYTATTTTETTTSITVTANYETCYTTVADHSDHTPDVPVTMNGCTYTFTVAPIPNQSHNTVEHTAHLVCPAGAKVEVHHPNCTVSIHPQTINTGLTYTTVGTGNGHEITMDVNVQFTTTRHGLCQFIAPTNGAGTLRGSVTVTAKNTAGAQIPLTAT
ncbi:MAG TPA: hypothetical protein VF729_02145 [Solirubrobacterales bacterium]